MQLQRRELKGRFCRVMTRQKLVQRGSQSVDIDAWGALCLAILFGRGIAGRAERGGIFGLAGFEVTRNAKIDQVDMPVGRQHDIGRFEVAEDDGRLAHMQVVEHAAKLDSDFQRFIDGQPVARQFFQVVFQCLAFDEVHDEVRTAHIGELLVDARQVGMRQAGKQHGLALEGVGCLYHFLRGQTGLAHFFDSY